MQSNIFKITTLSALHITLLTTCLIKTNTSNDKLKYQQCYTGHLKHSSSERIPCGLNTALRSNTLRQRPGSQPVGPAHNKGKNGVERREEFALSILRRYCDYSVDTTVQMSQKLCRHIQVTQGTLIGNEIDR